VTHHKIQDVVVCPEYQDGR